MDTNKSIQLMDLPPELLREIWNHINLESVILLSKALLPYTMEAFYRKVQITNLNSYIKFFRTLSTNDSLGPLVKEIDIDIPQCSPLKINEKVKLQTVLAGLQTLSQLTKIQVCFDPFTSLILCREIATTCLPMLIELEVIYPPFNDHYDWSIPHLHNVRYYPKLIHFKFDPATYNQTDFDGNEADDIYQAERDAELSEFEAEGEVEFTGREQYNVLTEHLDSVNFTPLSSTRHSEFNLSTLSVFNPVDLPNYINVLKSLGSTQTLTMLDLYHGECISALLQHANDSIQALYTESVHCENWNLFTQPILPFLLRFRNLRYLNFSAALVDLSDLVDYLKEPLPLAVLKLGPNNFVSISNLFRLIVPGKHKLSALKHLQLDVVSTINKEGVEVEPNWMPGVFEKSGVLALVELGKTYGVKVTGSAVNACYDE